MKTLIERALLLPFYGAVKTRIADRQKALWSRFIGAGFIAEDIQTIWPEANFRFFQLVFQGGRPMQSFQLSDLNLRELDELAKWLENQQEIAGPIKEVSNADA